MPTFSPRASRSAAFAALAALWIIVPSGAAVRLTASGLGCPDWPLCDGGQVVPESSMHAAIEGSNRILSAIVMIVVVLAWLVVLRTPGAGRGLRWASGVAAVSTVAQVPLGGITVLVHLHPLAVGAHFLLSMVALAAAALAVVLALDLAAGRSRKLSTARAPFAAIGVLAGAATLVTGVLVTAAGPHSGDREVVERFGVLSDAAYVHVRAAVVFVVLVAILVVWLWRSPADAQTRWIGAALVPAILAQVALGEYQWRNGLPVEVVAAHVSLGALVWALVVMTAYGAAMPAASARVVTDRTPRQRVASPA